MALDWNDLKGCLLGALFCCATSQVWAEGIRESNYLNADPTNAMFFHRWFDPRKPSIFESEKIGFSVSGMMTISSVSQPIMKVPYLGKGGSLVVLVEEEACDIGAQIRIRSKKSNSVPIVFEFYDAQGKLFDTQNRTPASGTTRQSFQSESFDHRFAAVRISSPLDSLTGVGEIWVRPCAVVVS